MMFINKDTMREAAMPLTHEGANREAGLNLSRGKVLTIAASTVLLAGCGGGPNPPNTPTAPMLPPPVEVAYEVTITNLTANQPLAPPTLVLQVGGAKAWKLGAPASHALEVLAEGGSGEDFADEQGVLGIVSGDAVIGPGETATLIAKLEVPDAETQADHALTVAAMLVNTNDAFVGMTGIYLDVGQTMNHPMPSYDAGTEANDEFMANLPGPAGGGEGYNPSREGDVDRVHKHPGVLTRYELTGSALGASHRFDNPPARLTLSRVEPS